MMSGTTEIDAFASREMGTWVQTSASNEFELFVTPNFCLVTILNSLRPTLRDK